MKLSLNVFVETAINNSFFIDQLDNSALDTEYPNRLSYHRILLVEKGSGTLIVDDNTFEVRGQELFLLAKGQVYLFEKPSIVSGYILSFGDCFWEKCPASASNCKAVLFNNAAANQCLQLSYNELSELIFLFKTLLSEFKTPHYSNQIDAMAAYLKIIMIKVANVKITHKGTFDSQDYILYRNFMDLLSVQYKSCREVSNYAKMLGVTVRRLSELCKRCSNKSAKEIINGQLVAEAKRSLQFSSSPVKEIAYLLNFNSPEQFSNFFKKNTNFSPANYRDHFVSMGS
jgi:AraC family transcriptional activator of pobA